MFSSVEHEGCLSSFAQAFTGPTLLKLRQRGIVAELWPNGAGFRNHRLNFVWSISCEAGSPNDVNLLVNLSVNGMWRILMIHEDSSWFMCMPIFSSLLSTCHISEAGFAPLTNWQRHNATRLQGRICMHLFWHVAFPDTLPISALLCHIWQLHRPLRQIGCTNLLCLWPVRTLSGPVRMQKSGCRAMLALYLVCWFRHSLHDAHSFMVFYIWTYM